MTNGFEESLDRGIASNSFSDDGDEEEEDNMEEPHTPIDATSDLAQAARAYTEHTFTQLASSRTPPPALPTLTGPLT